jgi:hypothetical protein
MAAATILRLSALLSTNDTLQSGSEKMEAQVPTTEE